MKNIEKYRDEVAEGYFYPTFPEKYAAFLPHIYSDGFNCATEHIMAEADKLSAALKRIEAMYPADGRPVHSIGHAHNEARYALESWRKFVGEEGQRDE